TGQGLIAASGSGSLQTGRQCDCKSDAGGGAQYSLENAHDDSLCLTKVMLLQAGDKSGPAGSKSMHRFLSWSKQKSAVRLDFSADRPSSRSRTAGGLSPRPSPFCARETLI